MPYRHAHWAIALLLALAGLAFWPTYFSVLGTTRWPFHAHAIASTLWMLVLLAQSISIHSRRRPLHRQLGTAIFLLVPLFTAATAMMFQTLMSSGTGFAGQMGARILVMEGPVLILFPWFAYQALRHRRNPWLHGGWLLATPLMLVLSIVTRLDPGEYTTWFAAADDVPGRFGVQVATASLLVLMSCSWLYRQAKGRSAPAVTMAIVALLQWGSYHLVDEASAAQRLAFAVGRQPIALVGLAGLVVGITAVWFGWQHSVRKPTPAPLVAASA
ncbi:MAG: hypothetical protein ABMA15_10595 [Vicinamibacterales bacterium]